MGPRLIAAFFAALVAAAAAANADDGYKGERGGGLGVAAVAVAAAGPRLFRESRERYKLIASNAAVACAGARCLLPGPPLPAPQPSLVSSIPLSKGDIYRPLSYFFINAVPSTYYSLKCDGCIITRLDQVCPLEVAARYSILLRTIIHKYCYVPSSNIFPRVHYLNRKR